MPNVFIADCITTINNQGIPWSVVSRKTGIGYNRLRGLRAGSVAPTMDEFINLGTYCGFDLTTYLKPQAS